MMSHWDGYVQLCKPGFSSCTFRDELITICDGNEDIAWVVFHHNQEQAINWMQQPIPALKGELPANVVKINADKLKNVLLSFPS